MASGQNSLQRVRSLAVRSTRFGGLMGASIYSQIVQFAFFLLAARVIAVAEFGLFSLVFAIAMGLTVLAEAGWREYITCNDDERLLARARGVSGLVSAVISIAGLVAAVVVGLVLEEKAGALTIAALALWVPMRSRCTLMWGQLTKENRIHQLSLSVFISESCGLIAGAAALFAGWGMVALGVSKLVLQVVALICLSRSQNHGLQPTIWHRCPEDREMLSFSSQIMVGRISNFLRSNISVFVIGFGLSALAVGYYRAAARITGAVLETLREPSRVILWSGVRDAGNESDDPDKAQASKAEKLGPILLSFAALALVLFALLAELLIAALLGAKWLPAAPVASILAVAYLIGFVTVLSEPLFSLTNQPKLARNLAIASSAIACTGIVVAAPFGLHAVAWSELASSSITAVLTLYMLGRYTRFSSLQFLRSLTGTALGLLATFLVVEMLGASSLIAEAHLLVKILVLAASGTLAFALVIGLQWLIGKRLRPAVGAMAGIALCVGAAGMAWMGMPITAGAAVTSPIHRTDAAPALAATPPAIALTQEPPITGPVASPIASSVHIAEIAKPSRPPGVYQLPVAPGGGAAAPVLAALDLCGSKPFCKVIGIAPASADPAFLYVRDRRTGVERTLWDCITFPRKNTAQCLSADNRSWAGFEGNFQTGGA